MIDIAESANEKVTVGFFLGKKHFPQYTNSEILAALDLCLRNGGLYCAQKPEFLLAYFRYHPGVKIGEHEMLGIVTDMDYEVLKTLNLREGPVIHVVSYIDPSGGGYRNFRDLITYLNPFGISFHRFHKGKRRFGMLQNVRFKRPQ